MKRRLFLAWFSVGGWFILLVEMYWCYFHEGYLYLYANFFGELWFELVGMTILFVILCIFLIQELKIIGSEID